MHTHGLPRENWLLLSLLAAKEKGLTPVQLQKVLFVFGRRRPDTVRDSYYDFKPYHYGPFDSAVYADADMLAARELIAVDQSNGRSLRTYRLTPEGHAAAATARNATDPREVEFMGKVVEWAQRLSFSSLVRSVYEEFPEMREHSVFRD
jgi:hypothetical protein